MSAKYVKGLHWIICGDTNDLKLDSILQMNSNLKQVVLNPTRMNPPRILDPIITSLSSYYQKPECLPPLVPDPDCNGKPSDHCMVLMTSISAINNKPGRVYKQVRSRPISEQGLNKMKEWLKTKDWTEVLQESSAHSKAEISEFSGV